MTKPVLHELVWSLSFTNSSARRRSLFGTMFLVAFYGLFRIGELTTKSTNSRSSVVQYNSLTFLSRNSLPQVAKTSISEFKHNPPRSHLTFYWQGRILQFFARLLLFCSILGFVEISRVQFSVTLIFRLSLFINLTPNFRGV